MFSFSVEPALPKDGCGWVITLTNQSTGQQKVFKKAGSWPVSSLIEHMSSLTERQCEDFFNKEKK